MEVGAALALGLGTTALGMTVTFITLFGLCLVLELMSRVFSSPNQQI